MASANPGCKITPKASLSELVSSLVLHLEGGEVPREQTPQDNFPRLRLIAPCLNACWEEQLFTYLQPFLCQKPVDLPMAQVWVCHVAFGEGAGKFRSGVAPHLHLHYNYFSALLPEHSHL